MDLFVNYPSKKLIGIKEYKKDDSLEDNYSNLTKDAYLIDIINNKSELLLKGISSHFNFYNEYMSFNKDEILDNSISEGYENLGCIYLFNGKDLKMIIDEPCHYGWDYFKGTEDVLNFGRQTGDRGGGSEGICIIIQKVMNL